MRMSALIDVIFIIDLITKQLLVNFLLTFSIYNIVLPSIDDLIYTFVFVQIFVYHNAVMT